ncbi:MAG: ABC transporter substrate-binding protein [Candidatus Rokubacteria bacterium]|nr:ABC transporter substrate-binding protein [Candidatus Rokubacteria bacterium]
MKATVYRRLTGLCLLVGLTMLVDWTAAVRASAQTLVVAGAPPIHEVTLPHLGAQSSKLLTRPMAEHLVQVDAVAWDYTKPMLAERWQMSADAKTWTFFLRKGVPFHGGLGDVTAEDVKFSLELLYGKDSLASTTAFWRKLIDRIEVVDPHTVRLHLKASSPDLLFELSNAREVQILSKKYMETVGVEKASQKPIGTGPYELVEWRKGEFMRFRALDKHWRVVPQFKELVIKFVPEDSTRVAMLRTGDADIIELPRSLKKEVQAAGYEARRSLWPGVVVFGLLGGQYLKERPTYNPKVPWLDKRVREAINLAVNRRAIVEHLFLGEAEAGTVPIIPSWVKEYNNPAWKPYPHDLARAKQLLAEAGYPNGFTAEWRAYLLSGVPELTSVSEALQIDLAKIGVKLELKLVEYAAGLRPDARARKLAGIGFVHRTGIPPVPEGQMAIFYGADGIVGGVELPEIQDLWARLGRTADPVERGKVIRAIGDILYSGYHVVPLVDLYPLFGINQKKVGEWKTTGYYGFTHLEYAQKR